jgi:hypothetical protein
MFELTFYPSPNDGRICGYTCAEWFESEKMAVFDQTPFGSEPERAIEKAANLQRSLGYSPVVRGSALLSPALRERVSSLFIRA